MGDHDAPATWFERWKAAEPVRLYLGSIAAAVIVLAVVAGVITQQLALGIGGVVAAVLMLGGGATIVRGNVYAPATVDALMDAQHAVSYEHGAEDMLSRELGAPTAPVVGPTTSPGQQLHRCLFEDEHGTRCRLAEHPRRVRHELEDAAG